MMNPYQLPPKNFFNSKKKKIILSSRSGPANEKKMSQMNARIIQSCTPEIKSQSPLTTLHGDKWKNINLYAARQIVSHGRQPAGHFSHTLAHAFFNLVEIGSL